MKKNCVIVILTFVGVVLSTELEISNVDVCDLFENCSCFKVKEYEIQCPPSEPDVVIHLLPDKYILIDCYNQTDYKLGIIPDAYVDVEALKVRFCCLLPLFKFKSILQKFNITHLKRLYLEECVPCNGTFIQIDSTFFDSLQSLESLSLREFGVNVFGINVFENLPNLTQLYLEQNELTEIGYMFENNHRLKVLHLSRNSLSSLPDGVFKKLLDLQELHLWKNELTNISKNYFIGLKSLKSLELSINSIDHIDEVAFVELPKLVNISLRSNRLGNIESGVFKYNVELENIRLGINPNLNLSDYVFANLVNLKSVSMEQCHLKIIPEHSFENCSNLISLDLQMNRLKILHQNLFKTLKNLKKLNLSKNKLASLPNKLFSSLENLEELNLEDNHLTGLNRSTLEGLSHLKILILRKNKILNIETTAFAFQTKLVMLDLSYNQWVQQYSVFSYLENIEQLLLSHNNISTLLDDDVLNTKVNLKILDLSYNYLEMFHVTSLVKVSNYDVIINLTHNKISYIEFDRAEEVFTQNIQIIQVDAYHNSNFTNTQVDISHNPLVCNCDNFDLIRYLKDKMNPVVKSFVYINVNDIKCTQPADFWHIEIKDLLPEQITGEYQKGDCPSECRCFKRCHDNAIIVDCSFRNLTDVPNLMMNGGKIEVKLSGNLLEKGPTENQGYQYVKSLDFSNNKLSTFDWCPPYIEELLLDHNRIKVFNSDVLQVFNKSTNFSKLTLAHNRWSCDCSALQLQNFIKTHFKKVDFKDVICEEDSIPLTEKKELCKSKAAIIAQIIIPILALFFLAAVICALYFRYKQEIKIWLFSKSLCLWFVTEEELDKDKKYDIFLSFSHKDEDFVAQNLVPSLEKTFKLCIHSRDWVPGELINDQIVDSVYNSRRTLVVLSNNFLESAWGKLEFLMAHKQSIEEGRPRVIVIKLGDLNDNKMNDDFKAYIKTNTYVEWGEPWFWKKLLYALPHSSKNTTKTNQKHANMMLKIDDKFELFSQSISHPESTPPVVSVDTTFLKKHPLNFSVSSSINTLPEIPLINK